MASKTEPLVDECPTCYTSGLAVYVADEHDLTCPWMQKIARRCTVHDELLMPEETRCPCPMIPADWLDPHNRITMSAVSEP